MELPSPSSAESSARASPEAPGLPVSTLASTAKLQPTTAAEAAAQLWHGLHSAATGDGPSLPRLSMQGRAAVRSLAPSFGMPRQSSTGYHYHQQQQDQQADSEQEQSPEKQPGKLVKSAKSAKMLLSAGLVSLTERLSEALSPPKGARQEAAAAAAWPDSPTGPGPHVSHWQHLGGRRVTVMGFEQQQHEGATLRQKASALMSPLRLGVRSFSVPGADPAGTASAGPCGHHAAGAGSAGGAGAEPMPCPGASRHAGGAQAQAWSSAAGGAGSLSVGGSRGGALSVPLALQASFVQASRSQRLRRRWLLVKAFKRYDHASAAHNAVSCASKTEHNTNSNPA